MDQYCLIPYTDVTGEIYHIAILYIIPLVCIAVTYLWITVFIRQSSRVSLVIILAKQQQRNLRDLTIIKRIVILISVLVVLRFPTVIFMVYARIVGHLHPLTYGIVGLITSPCLIFIGLITIYITPQLQRNIFIFLRHHDSQVHVQPAPMHHLRVRGEGDHLKMPTTIHDGYGRNEQLQLPYDHKLASCEVRSGQRSPIKLELHQQVIGEMISYSQ
ncbi:unnamed protein product [Didymodactylos carnosus]|uniref:G-protein coupled receptors family 1 profile domain-containing protein n=1 Tax=Didymodactylos carnosus TaxID=1234261 RepID=A0A814R3X1_9BILA|nr:unnamed protein product [Didymodactylos carnosus]CAF1163922.1 unnamed protein product [Didymodactylos carnosus]CAF3891721.1 unnamed protein product [Didymodactylos carnosus]CAF3975590.1 unnamed protein product [Didymodactylos carnosus]